MRVTHILDCFTGGGKERRCMQLLQGLHKEGVELQVIIVNSDISYPEIYSIPCNLCVIDRKNRKLGVLSTIKEIRYAIKSFSPHVVQSWGLMSSIFIIAAFPLMNFRFIASYVADVISPKFLQQTWIINELCKIYCDKIVGNSFAGLSAYGIQKSKAVLIYNGLNEERLKCSIDKTIKKKELNITTDYVVAMIASFNNYKDYDTYLESAKKIVKRRNDITFLAVGTGVKWEAYKQSLTQDECTFIRMLGRRNDIDEILQVCDLTVLCTNPKIKEGLSNSIVESMAFGVPVLATCGGGTPELIRDGFNSFFIKQQQPDSVAEQIVDVLEDEVRLKTVSHNARNTILNSFMLSRMTKDFVNLYNNEG